MEAHFHKRQSPYLFETSECLIELDKVCIYKCEARHLLDFFKIDFEKEFIMNYFSPHVVDINESFYATKDYVGHLKLIYFRPKGAQQLSR